MSGNKYRRMLLRFTDSLLASPILLRYRIGLLTWALNHTVFMLMPFISKPYEFCHSTIQSSSQSPNFCLNFSILSTSQPDVKFWDLSTSPSLTTFDVLHVWLLYMYCTQAGLMRQASSQSSGVTGNSTSILSGDWLFQTSNDVMMFGITKRSKTLRWRIVELSPCIQLKKRRFCQRLIPWN